MRLKWWEMCMHFLVDFWRQFEVFKNLLNSKFGNFLDTIFKYK